MRSCTLYWTDWLYAGSEAAMSAAFMRMVDPRQLMVFADRAFRCDGLCPEEQMVLQLRAQGMDVEALSWTLCLNKIPFRPTRIAPLIPRSETCLPRRDDSPCVIGLTLHHGSRLSSRVTLG